MNAIEFTTELGPEPVLKIPKEVAGQLPKSGPARIIVLTRDQTSEWGQAVSDQALHEAWAAAAAKGLAGAYGEHEPEYGLEDIKR